MPVLGNHGEVFRKRGQGGKTFFGCWSIRTRKVEARSAQCDARRRSPSIARALAFERTGIFARASNLYFAIDGMMAYFT